MGTKLRNWLNHGSLALVPLVAQASPTAPKVKAAEVQATFREPNAFVETLKEFGWLWILVVLLFILIGVFIYLRKKGAEDDD